MTFYRVKNDVNVSEKNKKQKNSEQFFVCILKDTDEKCVPEFIDPVLAVKMIVFAKTSLKRSFSIQSVPEFIFR